METTFNPLGLRGVEFTEFTSQDTEFIHNTFIEFGFSKLKKHGEKEITYYNQNNIHFLINAEKEGFASEFTKSHGPAICSMGWKVDDAIFAHNEAVRRGAMSANDSAKDLDFPAIYGIGGSIIYFIDNHRRDIMYNRMFVDLESPVMIEEKGFMEIDHLTNNVQKGTMEYWANFYKDIFGFTEVRYFDIQGEKTALISYALRSPDGSFCIPINEGKDDNNNQIDEYLNIYNGAGVQHLAFSTRDIVGSLDKLNPEIISTLDIQDSYYDSVYDRVPNIKEDKEDIKRHQILIDGNKENGNYLLQIFTKNLFGPIFIEIIQRENDLGFGEGNFQALFDSIEQDQMKRGVLK